MRQRLEQAKLREQLDKQRQEQSSVEPANTTPGGAPDGTTTPASSTPTAPDPSPSAGDVNPMSLQVRATGLALVIPSVTGPRFCASRPHW
jgi:heme-binding NEAT domain protein